MLVHLLSLSGSTKSTYPDGTYPNSQGALQETFRISVRMRVFTCVCLIREFI